MVEKKECNHEKLDSFRVVTEEVDEKPNELPVDLLIYLNQIMSNNANVDQSKYINFHDKEEVQKRNGSKLCPDSIKQRWVYACSCLGFIGIEATLGLALECLFVAMDGSKITLKDMEPVVRIIIKEKLLEEEKNENPGEKTFADELPAGELS